jgi:hydroxysqualene dehydroxylase
MLNHSHVAVIGGGLAGQAAAVTLCKAGIKTSLYEAGSQLGGRARSVAVESNSQIVQLDNGQHIMLGAYHETLKLLAEVGVTESQAFLRLPLDLETLDAHGKVAFKLSNKGYLPYPFNQLMGFLTCKGISVYERLSVVRMLSRLGQNNFQTHYDESLFAFLGKQSQSLRVIQLLWEPLCLSALNTPIHQASSKVFLNVLRDTFQGKHSSDVLLPRHDLSKIFSQPIARYLLANGGALLTDHRVSYVTQSEGSDQYKVVCNKAKIEYSHIIIATSPARVPKLVTHLPKLSGLAEMLDNYQYQPIYTIYLQYPESVQLPKPMHGLSGTLGQWVFDRGILCGQKGLISVIISADGKHENLAHETLALEVAQELKDIFPQLKKPLWHQVIAEKRATFTCKVNMPRPANNTSMKNLVFAGDYTYADYPATIEGAIRSGVKAAKLILKT